MEATGTEARAEAAGAQRAATFAAEMQDSAKFGAWLREELAEKSARRPAGREGRNERASEKEREEANRTAPCISLGGREVGGLSRGGDD